MNEAQSHVAEEFLKVRPKLRLYALKLTRDTEKAEDLLQDIFLRAVERAERYQRGTNFGGWITTMTFHHFVSGTRGVRNRPMADVSELSIPVFPRQEEGIRTRHLVKCLMLLPKDIRRILLMSGLEEMPYEAIAEITGLEVGTIKSKISRARDLLDGAL